MGSCPVDAAVALLKLKLRYINGAGVWLNHNLMVRRRRRGDKRSEKALLKSFNAAARGSGDDSDAPVILLTSFH